MKKLSIIMVLVLVSTSVLAGLISVAPIVNAAVDLTPDPVLVSGTSNVKAKIGVCAGDDGRTYVVWAERFGGTSDIMFSYSSNFGTTFAPYARVNNNITGTQHNPQALVDHNNNLLIAWEDAASDGGDIILSRSTDGGLTFQEINVSNSNYGEGTQTNPTIAASGDNVAIAWEEYRQDPTIRTWSGINGDLDLEIVGHEAAVLDVEYSPDGTMLASASEDGTVKLWNSATGTLIRNVTTQTSMATAVNWSADGSILAVGSFYELNTDDDTVILFNTTDWSNRTLNNTGTGPLQNNVNAISISPNRTYVAVACNGRPGEGLPLGGPERDYNVTVWNLIDNSSRTNSHGSSVYDIAFSHNGTYLASCGKDDHIRIWDPVTSIEITSINMGYDVHSITWSPDDVYLAAGLGNGSMAVVNITDSSDIYWLKGDHTGRVNSIDWDSSIADRYIVSGASDPVVKIWDEATGLESRTISGHTNSVYAVDWSTDGGNFVTAGGISSQNKMGENQIFCAVSSDGGLTFSPPVMVSDSCAGLRLRPDIGMDASGNISMVWYDLRKDGEGDTYFVNSTDGGVSFNMNIGIATESSTAEVSPVLFLEDDGTAHVTWQYDQGASVRYANSTDGFAQAYDMAYTAQTPHITGSKDGSNLWVSWRHDDPSLINHLWANVSYNGGASFADDVHLNFTNEFIGEHDVFIDPFNETSVVWEINGAIYFRTTKWPDDWAPNVVASNPADSDADVSIFTDLKITFSEPMDRTSVESALSWTDGTDTWTIGDCLGNTGVWNDYGNEVTFNPEYPLNYSKSYFVNISINALDLAGNTLGTDFSFSFFTGEDVDPPIVSPDNTTDSDNDGWFDWIEIIAGTDPFDENSMPLDIDMDGIADFMDTEINGELNLNEVGHNITWVNYDEEYVVTTKIVDWWGELFSTRLYYQGIGDSSPTNTLVMTSIGNDTYTATIPAQHALGIVYYYIEAIDMSHLNSTYPVNLSKGLLSYSVVDIIKPDISHVQTTQYDVFLPIEIWAVVTDEIRLDHVILNYRAVGSSISSFINITMQNITNGSATTFTCTIPAQNDIGNIVYNITATDTSNNTNSTVFYTVAIIDRTLPLINNVDTTYLTNETEVLVQANVTDDLAVDSVTLYFKAVGGSQWVPRPMRHVGGDIYEFTIPEQKRSGTIYFYVNVTDTSGNLASTLFDEDEYDIKVEGVGEDYTMYYILGAILAVLMAVFILLILRKFSRDDVHPSDGVHPVDENIPPPMENSPSGDASPISDSPPKSQSIIDEPVEKIEPQPVKKVDE